MYKYSSNTTQLRYKYFTGLKAQDLLVENKFKSRQPQNIKSNAY